LTRPPERVLVDTSAWIEALRPGGHAATVAAFDRCNTEGKIVTCGIVFLELLQGARTEMERDSLESQLESFPWLDSPEALGVVNK